MTFAISEPRHVGQAIGSPWPLSPALPIAGPGRRPVDPVVVARAAKRTWAACAGRVPAFAGERRRGRFVLASPGKSGLRNGREDERGTTTMTVRIAATALCALALPGAGLAQASDPEAVLIRTLDRAFKPGFLDTSGMRKAPDGSYHRLVTTGDAIMKPSFAKPLEAVRSACTQSGGTLSLLLSAGRAEAARRTATVAIGGERMTIDRGELYHLFTSAPYVGDGLARDGFRWAFRTSHFADRAGTQAEADPPFGLFGCSLAGGATVWAAAIMPNGEPRAYDLPVKVTPITRAGLAARRETLAHAQGAERRRVAAEDAAEAARVARERSEAVRLKPFRAGLTVGSRTNCGLVITVRGPLVQVQLPPNVTGPSGQREFWAPRADLTDAEAPQGCRFGG
jgi:hypothetical protein